MAGGATSASCRTLVAHQGSYKGPTRELYLLVTWREEQREFDVRLTDCASAWEATGCRAEGRRGVDAWRRAREALSDTPCSTRYVHWTEDNRGGQLQLCWNWPSDDGGQGMDVMAVHPPLQQQQDSAGAVRAMVAHMMESYSVLQDSLRELRAAHCVLSRSLADKEEQLEQCALKTQEREKDLFTKFAMLLNRKTERIQRLTDIAQEQAHELEKLKNDEAHDTGDEAEDEAEAETDELEREPAGEQAQAAAVKAEPGLQAQHAAASARAQPPQPPPGGTLETAAAAEPPALVPVAAAAGVSTWAAAGAAAAAAAAAPAAPLPLLPSGADLMEVETQDFPLEGLLGPAGLDGPAATRGPQQPQQPQQQQQQQQAGRLVTCDAAQGHGVFDAETLPYDLDKDEDLPLSVKRALLWRRRQQQQQQQQQPGQQDQEQPDGAAQPPPEQHQPAAAVAAAALPAGLGDVGWPQLGAVDGAGEGGPPSSPAAARPAAAKRRIGRG